MSNNNRAVSNEEFTKGTMLLAFDRKKEGKKNIKFFGKCKLSITPVEKCLTLKLDDGARTEMSSTFNRRFFVVENFLCASDYLAYRDYIIIFSQKVTCDKIFREIEKAKSTSQSAATFISSQALEEDIFRADFFIPIVKEIQLTGNVEIKELLLRLINSFDGNKKEFYFKLMVETLLSNDGKVCKPEPIENAKDTANDSGVVDDVLIKGELNEAAQSIIAAIFDGDSDEDEENDPSIPEEVEDLPNSSVNGATYYDDNNSGGDGEEDDNSSNSEEHVSESRKRKISLRERSVNVSYIDDEEEVEDDSSDDEIHYNFTENESSEDEDIPPTKKSKLAVKNEKVSTSSLDPLNFELVEFTEGGKVRKRLLVFTSSDRKKCYQYSYTSGRNDYQCRKCDPKKHFVYAAIAYDDLGTRELTFGKKEHMCEPIDYLPENYTSTKILKLPDFKIMEKPSKKRMVQRLIIFADKNKKFSYEYSLNDKGTFHCLACIILKRYVSAKLFKDTENGDYLELNRAKHICEPKEYVDPDTPAKTVRKPYFRIITVENGKGYKRRTLKIFDPKNMTMFYSYYYSDTFKYFICSGCTKKQPHRKVTATLCRDENGARYMELSKLEHVCAMKNSNSTS